MYIEFVNYTTAASFPQPVSMSYNNPALFLFNELVQALRKHLYRGYPAKRALSAMRKHGG